MARCLLADQVGVLVGEGRPVKSGREIVDILEAYGLTDSHRAATELAGCDDHTVARYVKLRDAVQSPESRTHRARPIDGFLAKIEELVARSGGRVRPDVVHRRNRDRVTTHQREANGPGRTRRSSYRLPVTVVGFTRARASYRCAGGRWRSSAPVVRSGLGGGRERWSAHGTSRSRRQAT